MSVNVTAEEVAAALVGLAMDPERTTLQEALCEAVNGVHRNEIAEADEDADPEMEDVYETGVGDIGGRSFADAGLLTRDDGAVLTIGNRRFQITVVEDRRYRAER